MDTDRIQGDEGNVGGGTNCCCYGGPLCLYQHMRCFYQYITSPMNVRYIYAAFFVLAITLAWGACENPQAFFRGQHFGSCEDDLDCLTVEAVLIFSLTSFVSWLFFSFMAISCMYTRTVLHSRRNSWHTQWWLPKMLLAASFLMISIVAPAGAIEFYGRAARLGAGVLLYIQLITIVRYITRLNSIWCQANTGGNHYLNVNYLNVNTVSILVYSASLIGIAIMFKHNTGSNMNLVLISSTLIMVYIMPLISQLSAAWGWYMEPGLMGLYLVFLCWSALKSQPDTSSSKKGQAGSSKSWEIISFVVGLFNIVVATFSTGNEYKSIQFKNVVGPEDDKPPYGYGFFHLAYALGSMYFGMLLLGWDTYHASKKWSIDVSWTSMWIHIANEVVAAIFFVAILLARIYATDSHRQFLAHMFGMGAQQHGDQSNDTETDTAQPPAVLPPTAEQHGDQSPATETDTGRPTSSLTPTTTEIHVDLSTIQ